MLIVNDPNGAALWFNGGGMKWNMITSGKRGQNFMSGEATFSGLKIAVAEMVEAVPADHNVVIEAFGIVVTRVEFAEPHTLITKGYNSSGHITRVVAHYSQMVARVIYHPQQEAERANCNWLWGRVGVS